MHGVVAVLLAVITLHVLTRLNHTDLTFTGAKPF